MAQHRVASLISPTDEELQDGRFFRGDCMVKQHVADFVGLAGLLVEQPDVFQMENWLRTVLDSSDDSTTEQPPVDKPSSELEEQINRYDADVLKPHRGGKDITPAPETYCATFANHTYWSWEEAVEEVERVAKRYPEWKHVPAALGLRSGAQKPADPTLSQDDAITKNPHYSSQFTPEDAALVFLWAVGGGNENKDMLDGERLKQVLAMDAPGFFVGNIAHFAIMQRGTQPADASPRSLSAALTSFANSGELPVLHSALLRGGQIMAAILPSWAEDPANAETVQLCREKCPKFANAFFEPTIKTLPLRKKDSESQHSIVNCVLLTATATFTALCNSASSAGSTAGGINGSCCWRPSPTITQRATSLLAARFSDNVYVNRVSYNYREGDCRVKEDGFILAKLLDAVRAAKPADTEGWLWVMYCSICAYNLTFDFTPVGSGVGNNTSSVAPLMSHHILSDASAVTTPFVDALRSAVFPAELIFWHFLAHETHPPMWCHSQHHEELVRSGATDYLLRSIHNVPVNNLAPMDRPARLRALRFLHHHLKVFGSGALMLLKQSTTYQQSRPFDLFQAWRHIQEKKGNGCARSHGHGNWCTLLECVKPNANTVFPGPGDAADPFVAFVPYGAFDFTPQDYRELAQEINDYIGRQLCCCPSHDFNKDATSFATGDPAYDPVRSKRSTAVGAILGWGAPGTPNGFPLSHPTELDKVTQYIPNSQFYLSLASEGSLGCLSEPATYSWWRELMQMKPPSDPKLAAAFLRETSLTCPQAALALLPRWCAVIEGLRSDVTSLASQIRVRAGFFPMYLREEDQCTPREMIVLDIADANGRMKFLKDAAVGYQDHAWLTKWIPALVDVVAATLLQQPSDQVWGFDGRQLQSHCRLFSNVIIVNTQSKSRVAPVVLWTLLLRACFENVLSNGGRGSLIFDADENHDPLMLDAVIYLLGAALLEIKRWTGCASLDTVLANLPMAFEVQEFVKSRASLRHAPTLFFIEALAEVGTLCPAARDLASALFVLDLGEEKLMFGLSTANTSTNGDQLYNGSPLTIARAAVSLTRVLYTLLEHKTCSIPLVTVDGKACNELHDMASLAVVIINLLAETRGRNDDAAAQQVEGRSVRFFVSTEDKCKARKVFSYIAHHSLFFDKETTLSQAAAKIMAGGDALSMKKAWIHIQRFVSETPNAVSSSFVFEKKLAGSGEDEVMQPYKLPPVEACAGDASDTISRRILPSTGKENSIANRFPEDVFDVRPDVLLIHEALFSAGSSIKRFREWFVDRAAICAGPGKRGGWGPREPGGEELYFPVYNTKAAASDRALLVLCFLKKTPLYPNELNAIDMCGNWTGDVAAQAFEAAIHLCKASSSMDLKNKLSSREASNYLLMSATVMDMIATTEHIAKHGAQHCEHTIWLCLESIAVDPTNVEAYVLARRTMEACPIYGQLGILQRFVDRFTPVLEAHVYPDFDKNKVNDAALLDKTVIATTRETLRSYRRSCMSQGGYRFLDEAYFAAAVNPSSTAPNRTFGEIRSIICRAYLESISHDVFEAETSKFLCTPDGKSRKSDSKGCDIIGTLIELRTRIYYRDRLFFRIRPTEETLSELFKNNTSFLDKIAELSCVVDKGIDESIDTLVGNNPTQESVEDYLYRKNNFDKGIADSINAFLGTKPIEKKEEGYFYRKNSFAAVPNTVKFGNVFTNGSQAGLPINRQWQAAFLWLIGKVGSGYSQTAPELASTSTVTILEFILIHLDIDLLLSAFGRILSKIAQTDANTSDASNAYLSGVVGDRICEILILAAIAGRIDGHRRLVGIFTHPLIKRLVEKRLKAASPVAAALVNHGAYRYGLSLASCGVESMLHLASTKGAAQVGSFIIGTPLVTEVAHLFSGGANLQSEPISTNIPAEQREKLALDILLASIAQHNKHSPKGNTSNRPVSKRKNKHAAPEPTPKVLPPTRMSTHGFVIPMNHTRVAEEALMFFAAVACRSKTHLLRKGGCAPTKKIIDQILAFINDTNVFSGPYASATATSAVPPAVLFHLRGVLEAASHTVGAGGHTKQQAASPSNATSNGGQSAGAGGGSSNANTKEEYDYSLKQIMEEVELKQQEKDRAAKEKELQKQLVAVVDRHEPKARNTLLQQREKDFTAFTKSFKTGMEKIIQEINKQLKNIDSFERKARAAVDAAEASAFRDLTRAEQQERRQVELLLHKAEEEARSALAAIETDEATARAALIAVQDKDRKKSIATVEARERKQLMQQEEQAQAEKEREEEAVRAQQKLATKQQQTAKKKGVTSTPQSPTKNTVPSQFPAAAAPTGTATTAKVFVQDGQSHGDSTMVAWLSSAAAGSSAFKTPIEPSGALATVPLKFSDNIQHMFVVPGDVVEVSVSSTKKQGTAANFARIVEHTSVAPLHCNVAVAAGNTNEVGGLLQPMMPKYPALPYSDPNGILSAFSAAPITTSATASNSFSVSGFGAAAVQQQPRSMANVAVVAILVRGSLPETTKNTTSNKPAATNQQGSIPRPRSNPQSSASSGVMVHSPYYEIVAILDHQNPMPRLALQSAGTPAKVGLAFSLPAGVGRHITFEDAVEVLGDLRSVQGARWVSSTSSNFTSHNQLLASASACHRGGHELLRFSIHVPFDGTVISSNDEEFSIYCGLGPAAPPLSQRHGRDGASIPCLSFNITLSKSQGVQAWKTSGQTVTISRVSTPMTSKSNANLSTRSESGIIGAEATPSPSTLGNNLFGVSAAGGSVQIASTSESGEFTLDGTEVSEEDRRLRDLLSNLGVEAAPSDNTPKTITSRSPLRQTSDLFPMAPSSMLSVGDSPNPAATASANPAAVGVANQPDSAVLVERCATILYKIRTNTTRSIATNTDTASEVSLWAGHIAAKELLNLVPSSAVLEKKTLGNKTELFTPTTATTTDDSIFTPIVPQDASVGPSLATSLLIQRLLLLALLTEKHGAPLTPDDELFLEAVPDHVAWMNAMRQVSS